jgi:chemotaxis methyl-accepting protein methylase
VDVREYRRPTIERRIRNRMISVAEPSLAAYARRIADSREEGFALLERVSIKVSEFYRNPDVFAWLHAQVLPALAARVRGRPLRVWSAGCGRGEEPWTLAMLLHDLGIDAVVEATDIDPAALSFARQARYKDEAIGALPSEFVNRYLDRATAGDEVRVDPELQRLVRFSLHDLLADPAAPGNGAFDLICCRNVLIYFQRAAQARTFQRLERALTPGGVLCVGEAEWPCGPAADSLFAAAPRIRIFHHRDLERAA